MKLCCKVCHWHWWFALTLVEFLVVVALLIHIRSMALFHFPLDEIAELHEKLARATKDVGMWKRRCLLAEVD